MANQKGFTLIELLVALAISSVLITALIPYIFHLTKGTAKTRDEITSTVQVQNAARQINRDVKLAAVTNLEDGAEAIDNLTIQWTEMYQDINQEHTVEYYVSEGELKRDYDGVVTTVAHYISDIEFSLNSSVVTVDITCTPEDAPEQSERGIYHVTLRQ